MSNKKHLILWASDISIEPKMTLDFCELIEVQDPSLALQFLKLHPVSVFVGSSRLGPDFFREATSISPYTIQILYCEKSDHPLVIDFINSSTIFYIVTEDESASDLKRILKNALEESEVRQAQVKLRKESTRQNRELEALNESLEKIVAERTAHIEISKKDEEDKLGRVRSLIRFIKELGTVSSIEELLQIIRAETKKLGRLGDPILLLKNSDGELEIYFFQHGQFLKSDFHGDQSNKLVVLPQTLSLNSVEIKKFLANHFGRPFVKTMVIPLEVKQSTKAVICIESSHSQTESATLVEFLLERVQPISLVVDRIILELEHTEIAFRWERTFDSFRDPIAIIDLDYEVLRSNRNYSDRQTKKKCFESFAGKTEPCEGCPLPLALSESKPQQGVIRKDGKLYQVDSYPINLAGGAATNVVNQYIDITNSRELYIRMLQSEKMGALGLLAGNIAHELNNPLTGLRSLTQVLLRQTSEESSIHSDLIEIEKATIRSQKIIKNLKEFSSKEYSEETLISLDEIVEATMPMLKALLRSHRLEIHLEAGNYLIKVEPQLMQQVVFNLMNNACQAMKTPGTLTVQTIYQPENSSVVLKVTDTGSGVPEQLKNRIFEPFFTTKKEGSGTGLGLSLSKEIVEKFNGTIELSTELNKGTEFRVILPLAEKRKENTI